MRMSDWISDVCSSDLGLLPGMPHMIILPAAGVAGYAAWRLRKGPAQAEESDAAETPEVENPAQIDWEYVSNGATLGLEIGYALIALVADRKGNPKRTSLNSSP